jgi:ABC-type branched-subunit amino acid transport system permease subunit
LIAIPAIRLSGLYLGLATLGFGILLADYGYTKSWMFGFGALATRRPEGWSSDTRLYYLFLLIAVGALVLVATVERSRLGRLLRALADAPVALTTLGANINVTRTLVFCISTFLAGISGATFASEFSSVNQASFDYVQSLVVLAVMAISGRRTLMVAVVAPILLYVVPGYISNATANMYLQLAFGLAAIVAAATSQGAGTRFLSRRIASSRGRLDDPILHSRFEPASGRMVELADGFASGAGRRLRRPSRQVVSGAHSLTSRSRSRATVEATHGGR